MPNHRRAWHAGGTYFFTVNLLQRRGNDLLTRHIDLLRSVLRSVRARHLFHIHGLVGHVADWPHSTFHKLDMMTDMRRNALRLLRPTALAVDQNGILQSRAEGRTLVACARGIWQRCYWEHLIRNDADMQVHMDYVHFNPVKHGLVFRVADWPHLSQAGGGKGIFPGLGGRHGGDVGI
jgi:putative transposase